MKVSNELFKGEFGLEVETLRINKNGHISKLDHPQIFNNDNPYITKDFAEAQIEMITPPMESVEMAVNLIEDIQSVVLNNIGEDFLWKQSNPPIINDDGYVQIAKLKDDNANAYREYLLETYGVEKSVISGVHFNFSFEESIINDMYAKSNSELPYIEFKNNLYLKIVKHLLNDRWHFIYLTNASPVFHSSYYENCVSKSTQISNGDCIINGLNSLRNSECGYRNKEDFIINYESLQLYKESVAKLIKENEISQERELYTPVRLKLNEDGNIQYIEIRFLDINPFENSGVSVLDLQYLHMYLIAKLFAEDFNFDEEMQLAANKNHAIAVGSKEGICTKTIEMLKIHNNIVNFHSNASSIYNTIEIFENILLRINDDNESYASKLKVQYEKSNYIDYHLNAALDFKKNAIQYSYNLKSLPTLELSTKILIREAIAQGLFFEILDINSNFIKLTNLQNQHNEIIQQATKTNLDNYANVLAMENKIITKSMLNKNNLKVAAGIELYSIDQVSKIDYNYYANKGVVIKPNKTNFGDGISIYPEGTDQHLITQAIDFAFSKDDTVIVEDFVSGKEYRFLIIDGEVTAVLHRRAANVVGDGYRTIAQLIDEKNKHPYRGSNYTSPLEYIKKGYSEKEFLSLQQFDFDTILNENEIAYLRENSNISTGGDSIDVTHLVDESYKQIAIDACKILDVNISGVDIIISDIKEKANLSNYSILELNYNPAIHIHTYPLVGINRHPAKSILKSLFKEREIR